MIDENEDNNLHAAGHAPGMMADEHDDSVALESGRPAVASAPGKILVFIVAGLICVAIVVKSLFFPSAGPVANVVKPRPEKVAAPSVNHTSGIGAGELPAPPPPDADIGTYNRGSSTSYNGGDNNAPDMHSLPPPPATSQTPALPPISMTPSSATGTPGSSIISPAPIVAPSSSMPAITAPTTSTSGNTGIQPPPPPPINQPPVPSVGATAAPRDEATLKRNASDMIAYGAGGGGKSSGNAKAKNTSTFAGGDPNSQFANAAIGAAHTDASTAERIEHLDYTIIQGKIIDCILETAIDSDLPGTLRAIVSHDVYAEAGRRILIPKGSRMLGTYNSAVKKGQARVFVIWTRVVRPDGITIDVDSPAVDSLGRAGIGGDIDNKYFEMFSSALLTSSLDIGVAAVGDALFGNQQTTTTNNGTGSSTTSSPTATAMQQAIDQIGAVGKTIVNNTVGLSPTITVDQGTPVNVFVNKELVFPPSVTDSQLYIN